MRRIVLVAASGLAREVASALRAGDADDIVAVLDDDPAKLGVRIGSVPVVGTITEAAGFSDCAFVVCAGSGSARADIVGRLQEIGVDADRYATVVHPSASIGENCSVGTGSIVLAHSVLTADVTVGEHVVAMPHVVLTHDDQVDDYATLCAGVVLGGGVRVREHAYLGMNSCVRENVSVGARAVLGMGAVALTDVPDDETRIGCPAAPLHGSSAA